MSDSRSPLLPQNRGGIQSQKDFERGYNDCIVQYNRIKQKNDVIQKTSDNDLDTDIIKEIKSQGDFIENQIRELHQKITQLKNTYKDPQSQNKLKKIQKDLCQQVERNKIIMTNYINRASSASFHNKQMKSHFIKSSQIQAKSKIYFPNHEKNQKQQNQYQSQSSIMQDDLQLQFKVQKQKNILLTDLQQRMNRVQAIMTDFNLEVNKQGQDLDIIGHNIDNTKNNMVGANQNLDQAQSYQKKSKKKCIIVIVFLLIIVIGVAGYFVIENIK